LAHWWLLANKYRHKIYSVGRFVIFLKTIALSLINELDHYPRIGIKDYQGEFLAVSSLDVVNK
jgi:hypothetical protein